MSSSNTSYNVSLPDQLKIEMLSVWGLVEIVLNTGSRSISIYSLIRFLVLNISLQMLLNWNGTLQIDVKPSQAGTSNWEALKMYSTEIVLSITELIRGQRNTMMRPGLITGEIWQSAPQWCLLDNFLAMVRIVYSIWINSPGSQSCSEQQQILSNSNNSSQKTRKIPR